MIACDIRKKPIPIARILTKICSYTAFSIVAWCCMAAAQTIRFVDVSKTYNIQGHALFATHGIVFGDADGDGYDEIYVSLALNNSVNDTVNDNNWLRIRCQGTKSDAYGLGSKISIYANQRKFGTGPQLSS